jgi:hypothetical protein
MSVAGNHPSSNASSIISKAKAAFHELSRNIESEARIPRSVENFLRRK